jgi:Tfp pilus assembly protein PilF
MKLVIRSLPGLVLCCAVLFGAGCASLSNRALCPAEGGDAWHEVRSAHFQVRTNLDPAEARKVTLDLERFRRALLLAWTRDFDPPGQLEVIAMRTRGQLAEFESSGYGAFTAFTVSGPIIVMDGGGDMYSGAGANRSVQAHELAHYLSRFMLVRQPRWFAEGLASYLETVSLGKDGKEAVIGGLHSRNLAYLGVKRWMKLEELWGWDQEYADIKDPSRHYASSWLWVYYLVNKHGQRFSDFQVRLALAEEPRKAFEEAFAGAGDLEAGLRAFINGGSFVVRKVPLPEVPTELRVREMEGAEVHAIRARLHMMGSGGDQVERRRAAQLEVTQGLSENPTNVSVTLLQADFMTNAQERLAMAEALVKARPDSGQAWGLLARAHSRAGSPVDVQEQAYVRAVQLSPEDANAHNELAWFYVISRAPRRGYESALRAVQLAPFSPEIVDTYAAVLFGMGRCSRSINAQRRAIDLLYERQDEAERKGFTGRLALFEKVCGERAAAAAANEEEGP